MSGAEIIELHPEPKLLPCPFCGEEVDSIGEYLETGDVAVQCENCQAAGPATRIGCRDDEEPIDLEAEAIVLWNGRSQIGKCAELLAAILEHRDAQDELGDAQWLAAFTELTELVLGKK